jgi:hypothetical protein
MIKFCKAQRIFSVGLFCCFSLGYGMIVLSFILSKALQCVDSYMDNQFFILIIHLSGNGIAAHK